MVWPHRPARRKTLLRQAEGASVPGPMPDCRCHERPTTAATAHHLRAGSDLPDENAPAGRARRSAGSGTVMPAGPPRAHFRHLGERYTPGRSLGQEESFRLSCRRSLSPSPDPQQPQVSHLITHENHSDQALPAGSVRTPARTDRTAGQRVFCALWRSFSIRRHLRTLAACSALLRAKTCPPVPSATK